MAGNAYTSADAAHVLPMRIMREVKCHNSVLCFVGLQKQLGPLQQSLATGSVLKWVCSRNQGAARLAVGLLDALGIEKAVVVGHSAGMLHISASMCNIDLRHREAYCQLANDVATL